MQTLHRVRAHGSQPCDRLLGKRNQLHSPAMNPIVVALPLLIVALVAPPQADGQALEVPTLRAGDGVPVPRKVRHVSPVFPDDLRQRQTMGLVFFDCLIGTDGHVEHVEVIAGATGLNEPAITAVQQWVFEPPIVEGRPVRIQMTASLEFALSPGPSFFPAWLKALRYPDPRVRRSAPQQIQRFGKRAVSPLIEALTDDDAGVRSAAAIALGNIGSDARTAVPALTRASMDADSRVRDASVQALSKLK
jgi:TonB family protein